MTKEIKLVLGIFILAVLAAAVFGYFYIFSGPSLPGAGNDEGAGDGNLEGYRTREELPPFPEDYDVIRYDLSVSGEISEDNQKKQEQIFADALRKIDEAPDSLELWITLGLVKKIFGDYKGARDAWEYAGVIRPKNSVSFINLADLYWHFIPDFPKAEFNFKKAIENTPENLGLYKDLSDFYRFSYAEKSDLADDILLEGLRDNPESPVIFAWLGGYYRDSGDLSKAREYYQKALEADPDNGAIRRELEELTL